MAIFRPSQIRENAPVGEKKLFAALRQLDDGWNVFHHICWQSKRNGRQGDGEADFLLMHEEFGALIVEVKGGTVDVRDGKWFSTNSEGTFEISNPYEQVVINKHAFLRILEEEGISGIYVGHAVCFPDCSEHKRVGTYGSSDVTWWRTDLVGIRAAVETTKKHWGGYRIKTATTLKAAIDLFAPTLTLRRRIVDEVGEVSERLSDLTAEQIRVFDSIQRNRRAVISGGPGTGKTLLSFERARRLAKSGFSVLWCCYNELLCEYAKRQLDSLENIRVATFHSLCIQQISKSGRPVPKPLDADFWEEASAEMLVDAAAINALQFDAIVIDEGQDFSQKWIDALQLLTKETRDPPMYVFSDENQTLYKRSWTFENGVELHLSINCRSSKPICRRVTAIIGEEPQGYGAEGPEPIFSEAETASQILDRIEVRATEFIEKQGLKPEQITVLSDDERFIATLRDRYAGEFPFVGFGGKGVLVESIRRFKGLENDVIFVAFPSIQKSSEKEVQRACYVGFSRAKSVLMVVAPRGLKKIISWS